jgi:hypothetical protein
VSDLDAKTARGGQSMADFIPASRPDHDSPVAKLAGNDLYVSTIVDNPAQRSFWESKQTCLFCSGKYRYSPRLAECHLDPWICKANTGTERAVFLCKPFPAHVSRHNDVLGEMKQRRSGKAPVSIGGGKTSGLQRSRGDITGSGMEGDAIQLGDDVAGGGGSKRPAVAGMTVCSKPQTLTKSRSNLW